MKTYRNIINKLIKHKLVICVVCTTIQVLQKKKMLTIKCKMTNKFSYGTKKVVVILLYLILETEKEREREIGGNAKPFPNFHEAGYLSTCVVETLCNR